VAELYEIVVAPSAEKDIAQLQRRQQERVIAAIGKLESNPCPPKSEKLANHPPFRRIRSGDYRIIYVLLEEERKVVILVVRHRREAYAALDNLPALLAKALKNG